MSSEVDTVGGSQPSDEMSCNGRKEGRKESMVIVVVEQSNSNLF